MVNTEASISANTNTRSRLPITLTCRRLRSASLASQSRCSNSRTYRAKHSRIRSWLEGRGATPTPIGKYLVMEHDPMVGRISMNLIPESLGW